MGSPLLDNSDYEYLCKNLTIATGNDYIDPDGLFNQKAKMIYEMAKKNKVTRYELSQYMFSFLEHQKYQTWLPANFFEYYERELLRDKTWLDEELEKFPLRNFEGYKIDVNGKTTKLWKKADGKILPFEQFYPAGKQYERLLKQNEQQKQLN